MSKWTNRSTNGIRQPLVPSTSTPEGDGRGMLGPSVARPRSQQAAGSTACGSRKRPKRYTAADHRPAVCTPFGTPATLRAVPRPTPASADRQMQLQRQVPEARSVRGNYPWRRTPQSQTIQPSLRPLGARRRHESSPRDRMTPFRVPATQPCSAAQPWSDTDAHGRTSLPPKSIQASATSPLSTMTSPSLKATAARKTLN